MRKIRIEPYKYWSGGAKELGERCGILRATKRQVEKHGDFDLIINWGSTKRRFKGEYLNEPEDVSRACDKLESFRLFTERGVACPPWTTERDVVSEWLRDGCSAVVRQMLRANTGRGIIILSPDFDEEIPRAPLYTQYVKKADEYRVHVFKGSVIDVQQKRKRLEVDNDDVDYQIRNSTSGWVYCRGGVDAPSAVLSAGQTAVDALGLDFGAADIGWNRKKEEPCVYEVNTAPGLEGQTLEAYYNVLRTHYPVLRSGRYLLRRKTKRGD